MFTYLLNFHHICGSTIDDCVPDLSGILSPSLTFSHPLSPSLNNAVFSYHCLHGYVVTGGFKISQLSFESQPNKFAALEALSSESLVIVATPHAYSITAMVESDDWYAYKLYVGSINAAPWANGRLPDAKMVLAKRGLTG